MIHIPAELLSRFNRVLERYGIPKAPRGQYRKWLRYYLDFCHKYEKPYFHQTSLKLFLEKLQQKNQTQAQKKHAAHAVSLYFELLQSRAEVGPPKKEGPEAAVPGVAESSRRGRLYPPSSAQMRANLYKSSHPARVEWQRLQRELSEEIRTRHYPPKTLSAYTLWARKFQAFTKQKPVQSLYY